MPCYLRKETSQVHITNLNLSGQSSRHFSKNTFTYKPRVWKSKLMSQCLLERFEAKLGFHELQDRLVITCI